MGKSDFHERKQQRIERYKALSEKAKKESDQAYQSSKDMVKHIPMGQPILVGHHSEKRHRNLLDKSWNKMGKSVELGNKATYYEDKAAAAENNTAISSDDPNAIQLLEAKIIALQEHQDTMKKINKICRNKKLSDIEIIDRLQTDFELTEKTIIKLLNPFYSSQKRGFASYTLSNNNQNINRLKKRLKSLEKIAEVQEETFVYGTTKVFVNVEDNRVEIHFPDKPDTIFRRQLKSNGFRWSPKKGAWQKSIHAYYIDQAKNLAKSYQIK